MSIKQLFVRAAIGWLIAAFALAGCTAPRALQPCEFLEKLPDSQSFAGMQRDAFLDWISAYYGEDYIHRENTQESSRPEILQTVSVTLQNLTNYVLFIPAQGGPLFMTAWIEPTNGYPEGHQVVRCLGGPARYDVYHGEEFVLAFLWYPDDGLMFRYSLNKSSVPSPELKVNLRNVVYEVIRYHPTGDGGFRKMRRFWYSSESDISAVASQNESQAWIDWDNINPIFIE